MNDYLVYHNNEKMGGSLINDELDSDNFDILTNKNIDLLSKVVWVIEGAGKPRQYYLCERFTVDVWEKYNKDGWAYRAKGQLASGERYRDTILLNSLPGPWFRDFQRRMANFSLGPQRLDVDDCKYLQKLVSERKKSKKSAIKR